VQTTLLAIRSVGAEALIWLGILAGVFALEGLLRTLMRPKGEPETK
jgi:hypothetical protein